MLGYAFLLAARAQPIKVECPCPIEQVKKTPECWNEPNGGPGFVVLPETPTTQLRCFLSDRESPPFTKTAQISVFAGHPSDPLTTAQCRITYTGPEPFCGPNEDPPLGTHQDLTPEELKACQCELQAYVTALNEVEGISVSGGPPYTCGDVQCDLPPSTIVLSPETATNDVLTDHTVTATVDIDGIPEPGVLVTFQVTSGPNAAEMSDPGNGECTVNDDCTTDENGQVSWTYSSVQLGTDTIVASFFDEQFEMTIESNTVEKIWVITRNVPTLTEWGLIALAGILGLVGLMVIRRRKVTA